MFTWANLIAALLNFVSKLLDYLADKDKAEQQKAEADATAKAKAARDAAVAEFDHNGLREPKSDPNCRD